MRVGYSRGNDGWRWCPSTGAWGWCRVGLVVVWGCDMTEYQLSYADAQRSAILIVATVYRILRGSLLVASRGDL